MLKNNRLIIVAAVVIVFLLAGGAVYLKLSKTAVNPQNQTANASPTPKPTQAGKSPMKSLIDLLSQNQSLHCTFNNTTANGGVYQGTIYVANGNMRGNFSTTENNKETFANVIRKENETYVWTNNSKTGFKMTVSIQDLSNNTQANQYVNSSEKINYSCFPWTVDNSMFIPPANIQFTDVTSLMPHGSSAPFVSPSATSGTQTASPCDQITDPTAKAACLNAMHQNGY